MLCKFCNEPADLLMVDDSKVINLRMLEIGGSIAADNPETVKGYCGFHWTHGAPIPATRWPEGAEI